MEIVTWNIQVAQGVDGRIDVVRIAQELKKFGDVDVICLQEVTRESHRNFNISSVEWSGLADELSKLFPEYEMFYGPAIDRLGGSDRQYFGNMILSKIPVESVFMHRLPQPSDSVNKNMARQAIEAIVRYRESPLRIITTHLEYFAVQQRAAQLEYLKQYQLECCDRMRFSSPSGQGSYASPPDTDRTILCGDFNFEVDSNHYRHITDEGFADSWRIVHGTTEHQPTCGIYDTEQWPNGKHCRDFFFTSDSVVQYVSDIAVNTDTQASDHQPVKLVLN